MTPVTTINVAYAPLQFRHELKHVVNAAEGRILSARLRRLFPSDVHADAGGCYRVTSLYFDTPNDEALVQKIEGVCNREKFRLRYYGLRPAFVKLEKKVKKNGMCAKRAVRLSVEDARRIACGESEFLANAGDPLLLEFYSKARSQQLRPCVVVSYEREAFTYAPGNVRVTVDRDLRSGAPSSFFRERSIRIPAGDGLEVVEVKFDDFLPDVVRMAVQVPHRRAGAYSKYAVCRRFD